MVSLKQVDLSKVQIYLDWLKTKIFLDSMAPNAASRFVKRGQVYECNLGVGVGSEEQKIRPCVILQRFEGNTHSPNTIVAPITHSGSALDVVAPITTQYNPDGSILLDGYALLGNITTVSKARLGNLVAALPPHDMKKIDKAIAVSLEVYSYYDNLENQLKGRLQFIDKIKAERNEAQDKLKEIKELLNVDDINDIVPEIQRLLSEK